MLDERKGPLCDVIMRGVPSGTENEFHRGIASENCAVEFISGSLDRIGQEQTEQTMRNSGGTGAP